jgi:GR25 family glycosyltransferase involved in LPS biosynthesis
MQAYYINLPESEHRRRVMEGYVRDFQWPGKRFMAITKAQVDSGEFDARYILAQGIQSDLYNSLKRHGRLTSTLNTTVACFLSHMEALELAQREASSKDQLIMIAEDDLELGQDWPQRVQDAIDAAPDDWSLIKLSGWGNSRSSDSVASRRAQYVGQFFRLTLPYYGRWSVYPYYGGSAAYVVRNSTISTVLQHLRSKPITDYDAMLLSNGSLNAFEIFPHVFSLRPEHEFSAIRPNGILASFRWAFSKVTHGAASALGACFNAFR